MPATDSATAPCVIIVSEGLAASADGNTTDRPSHAYCAVLDYARMHYGGARVYLAPANTFGGRSSEQQAGADYLRQQNFSGEVIAPPTPADCGYVDTRGNARLLRAYCETNGLAPLPPAVLLSGVHHRRRAAMCFRQEGFRIIRAIGVSYAANRNAHYPRRLWYYRYPLAHRAYEAAAICRDFLLR